LRNDQLFLVCFQDPYSAMSVIREILLKSSAILKSVKQGIHLIEIY